MPADPRHAPRRTLGIIPARMASSRYPGKPLAAVLGKPMLQHVYERAAASSLDRVVIATCDRAIVEAAEAFGARAVMTADTHQRASDRIAEAAGVLEAEDRAAGRPTSEGDIIVLLQGDEPTIRPGDIDAAVAAMGPSGGGAEVQCVNLTTRITSAAELEDRNTIKVAIAANGDALYFSRAPLPSCARTPFAELRAWKQVCVIPFTRASLRRFGELEPTPLEQAESIDMLRFLEHGIAVRMVPIDHDVQAVDVPDDVAKAEAMMRAG